MVTRGLARDKRRILTSAATSSNRVRLRDAYRFFTPLLLMAELTMFSHAIVAAFLARMPNPTENLAAYSIAFFFHSTMGSPLWACQMVSLSFMRDQQAVRRMLVFSAQVMASIGWVWIVLGATPAGDWFYGSLFGLSQKVTEGARQCTLILVLMLPLVAVRSLMYALMMRARRTLLVTYGTIIRLVALGVALYLMSGNVEGPKIGALAIIACIVVETLFSIVAARSIYGRLSTQQGPPVSYKELWIFAWPIMVMHTAEHGVNFLVSLFLGRLPRPELALAVFSVADSILRVLLSPLRNLTITVQSLSNSALDFPVLGRFCAQIALAFAALMTLFFIPPINHFALTKAMGLTDALADYAGLALTIGILLALSIGAAAAARGFLIASRQTKILAISSALRLVAVVTVGSIALLYDASNGAAVGLWALTAAFATEAVVLTIKALGLRRDGTLRPTG